MELTRRLISLRVAFAFALGAYMAAALDVGARQFSKTDGTAMSSAGVPTIGSCSTATLKAGATDSYGTVLTIPNISTCVVNFSTTLASAPSCVASMSDLNAASIAVTTTTTTLTVTTTNGMTGNMHYLCAGGF